MKNKRYVSLSVESNLLDKFYYISKYYGRSGCAQIQYNMRMLVDEFESMNGEITQEDITSMYSNFKK